MFKDSLTYNAVNIQVSKDRRVTVPSRTLVNFVHDLIRDYATNEKDGYDLYVNDLPFSVKKLFLATLLTPYEYQYYAENETRLQEGIAEHEVYMQQMIDREVDEVYGEDMREKGLKVGQHRDNGEKYYY